MRRAFGLVIAVLSLSVPFAQTAAAATGPERVRDLGSNELVQSFTPIGSRILFTANDGVHGRELFVSDGTYDGTGLVDDINPGSGDSMTWSAGSDNPNSFIGAGDRAYFLATDGQHGVGVYVSDGTSDGTLRLMRRRPCEDAASNDFVVAGSRLVFAAKDSAGTCNLYASDGTVVGTTLVIPDVGAFHQPHYFNGRVFFVAGTDNQELWKTDAQPGGITKRVKSFSAQVSQLTDTGNRLYFTTGIVASTEDRLWKTDGTRAGTHLVNPDHPLSADNLTAVGNVLVFEVQHYEGNGLWDRSLWRTNGRSAGTLMLTDFGDDKYSSVSRMWPAGKRVFMLAGTDLPGYGMWVTDGASSAGTKFVAKMSFFDAVGLGGILYGNGCYRDDTTVPVGCGSGALFLTSDGTPAGSHDIPGAVNLLPDVATAGGTIFLNVNGELFRYVP